MRTNVIYVNSSPIKSLILNVLESHFLFFGKNLTISTINIYFSSTKYITFKSVYNFACRIPIQKTAE